MKHSGEFTGFSSEIFRFFEGLEKDNSKSYFDANRVIYDTAVIAPAKLLISALAPFLAALSPEIRTEAKFNQTIMRINNDMRFSKGAPYKTFLLLHFGKFKMDSEFYIYVSKDSFCIGLFVNGNKGEHLYWKQNKVAFSDEIKKLSSRTSLENRFVLSTFDKEPVVLKKKFSFRNNFEMIEPLKYFMLERQLKPTARSIKSADIIPEIISVFGALFPLYAFTTSPLPLELINKFDKEFSF